MDEAANVRCKISSDPLLINDEHHSADWASMPGDILKLILERLVAEVSDYVHFAAACKSWLSAARDHLAAKRNQPFFPVLLLPTKDNDSQIYRGWYNPIENRFVNYRLQVPYNQRCCGSSNGWLIFAEENLALILYNPFTRATIHLPPVTLNEDIHLPPMTPTKEETRDGGFFYHYHHEISKVVLSTDPSIAPENYEVVANLKNGKLFFFRCGWSEWVAVLPDQYFEEITYFNGKLYAADHVSVAHIDVCDRGPELNSVSVTLRSLATRPFHKGGKDIYLAGTSEGNLLLIDRFIRYKLFPISRYDSADDIEWDDCMRNNCMRDDYPLCRRRRLIHNHDVVIRFTSQFKVYEVKEGEGKMGLTRLRTLEGQSLFLSRNNSEPIWTGDFPEYKANRIYCMDFCHVYPDEDVVCGMGLRVFDLETRSLQLLEAGPVKGHMPPPIWILPKASLETTF